MESDPFTRINPESSPEKSDKDSKSEKKSGKKRSSFIDELMERRSAKESKNRDEKASGSEGNQTSKKEAEPTKKELAKEFLEQKAEDLKDEIENHSSLEQAVEAQADLALVEAISEKIDDPDTEAEPAVQEAYDELMEAMDELETEPSDPEETTTETTDTETQEPDIDTVQTASPSTPATSGGGSHGGSTPPPRGGTTSPPPPPPRRPAQPVTPLPPVGVVSPTPNHNLAPTTSSPEAVAEEERRKVAGKVIVAGAIGYMIGRRGGRKRAEARLVPEIKKRDEVIVDLKQNIETKEFNLRQKAREEYSASKRIEEKPSAPPENHEITPEEYSQLPRLGVAEEAPHQPEVTSQKTAETPHADYQTVAHETKVHLEKAPSPTTHIETIPTPTLLHMAEKIKVLDTTVKKLYETNQIDRRGLEEIVKEHLRGHDIAPVLDKRLLGKEAILDRSHEYRHDPTTGLVTSDDTTDVNSDDSTKKHIPEKTASVAEQAKPDHPPLHTTHYENVTSTSEQKTDQKSKEQPKQTTTIAAIAVVAIIIAAFTTWLLLSI